MSDEVKKPEAGEWWQRTIPVRGVSNVRMYMVGRAFDGRMIGMRKWLPGEISDGADFMFGIIDGIDHIEHLPGCDSWEWKPEPKRAAVRLYWYDGHIVGRYDHSQPTDESFHEIKSDGNGGWYVESSL